MKQLLRFFFVLIFAPLFGAIPFASAQEVARPTSESGAVPASYDVVGARLIAWSEFQKPQPLAGRSEGAEATAEEPAGQTSKNVSTPKQTETLEVISQPANSYSSSTNKDEPGGR
jgi:hypothetical protein